MEERVIVCRSFVLCEDYVNYIVIIEYDEPHSKARLRILWASPGGVLPGPSVRVRVQPLH